MSYQLQEILVHSRNSRLQDNQWWLKQCWIVVLDSESHHYPTTSTLALEMVFFCILVQQCCIPSPLYMLHAKQDVTGLI